MPNKNLRELCGKPLMAYTIEQAISSKLFEHVVVSTDSEAIAEKAKSYGAETITIVKADPDNDNGDPKEHIIRYNRDPSWDEEIIVFVNAILNRAQVQSGSSKDALKTMELVYKIYFSDIKWREKYDIKNPDI